MTEDNRSDLVKKICDASFGDEGGGCKLCPLHDSCTPHHGDTKAIYDARMNKAAEELRDE